MLPPGPGSTPFSTRQLSACCLRFGILALGERFLHAREHRLEVGGLARADQAEHDAGLRRELAARRHGRRRRGRDLRRRRDGGVRVELVRWVIGRGGGGRRWTAPRREIPAASATTRRNDRTISRRAGSGSACSCPAANASAYFFHISAVSGARSSSGVIVFDEHLEQVVLGRGDRRIDQRRRRERWARTARSPCRSSGRPAWLLSVASWLLASPALSLRDHLLERRPSCPA